MSIMFNCKSFDTVLRLWTKFSSTRTNIILSSKNQIALFHKDHALNTHTNTQDKELSDESESDSETNSQKNEQLISLKLKILHAGLDFVPDHGWSKKSVALGAQAIGLSPASHTLINYGGADLVHYFNFLCNENINAYIKNHALELSQKKNIQEYIENVLEKRLSMVYPYVSRWNEALSLMVLPSQALSDIKNLLELMDIIWSHSAAKELNTTWYSKRLSLAVAYRLSEISLIQDKSPEFSNSLEFLKKRVEMVVYSEEILEQVMSSGQHLPKYGLGALITMQNIFGLNRWFR